MYLKIGLVLLANNLLLAGAGGSEPLKALIIDGQNNHDWRATTPVLRRDLETSGLFKVDVATSPEGADTSGFRPDFQRYRVVVSNYNGHRWPHETEQALVQYVHGGGGLVIVHAANNSFPDWKEYNDMIGLGGWGGRNEKSGPYVRLRGGQIVRVPDAGIAGNHGKQHPFRIVVRDARHPITAGMLREWLHSKDELYDRLRGPAANLTVLATAYSDPATDGSGQHEPIIFTVDYGKGRVFHTPMGHSAESMTCVGFITTLLRGAQWAAGEKVSYSIPEDFPSADKASLRKPDADVPQAKGAG